MPATFACKGKVVRKGALSQWNLLLLHHKKVDHKEVEGVIVIPTSLACRQFAEFH